MPGASRALFLPRQPRVEPQSPKTITLLRSALLLRFAFETNSTREIRGGHDPGRLFREETVPWFLIKRRADRNYKNELYALFITNRRRWPWLEFIAL